MGGRGGLNFSFKMSKIVGTMLFLVRSFNFQLFVKFWQMLDERSVQMVSTSINIFEDKGSVEAMLNESLNQFNLIQHTFNKLSTFFTLSSMLISTRLTFKQLDFNSLFPQTLQTNMSDFIFY